MLIDRLPNQATRCKTKRNFSVQANMKVFELSKAVVEDGFAKKASYATAP